MTAFPADKVTFLTVNQGESKARVDRFLTTRSRHARCS